MRFKFFLLLIVFLLPVFVSAGSVLVLDINPLSSDVYDYVGRDSIGNYLYAESITLNASYDVDTLMVWVSSYSFTSSEDEWFAIESDTGNSPSGLLVSPSSNVSVGYATLTSGAYNNISFTPVSLISGVKYWIVFGSTEITNSHYYFLGRCSNCYPDGTDANGYNTAPLSAGGLDIIFKLFGEVGCVANWSCVERGDCVNDTRACLNVSDVNECGGRFSGDLGDFDLPCNSSNGGGNGSCGCGCMLNIEVPKNPYYSDKENFSLYFLVFDGYGFPLSSGVSCNIKIFNDTNNEVILYSALNHNSYGYFYVIPSGLGFGVYPYVVSCDDGVMAGFVNDVFYITPSGEYTGIGEFGVLLGFLVCFIPLFVSYLLMRWADILSEEQNVFRLTISFASLVFVIMSLWLVANTITRFVFWGEMVKNITTGTYVYVLFLAVVFFYWLVYLLWMIFKGIMSKKEEKMEY